MAFTHKGSGNSHRGIARKRKSLGLTQHDLARHADVLLSRLVFFETGRIELLPEELDRIRHALRRRLKTVTAEVAARDQWN